MKKHKLLIALAAVTALSMTACNEPQTEKQPEVPEMEAATEPVELLDISNEFSLKTSSKYIKAGEQLEINIITESSRHLTVEWKSSDDSILTVENGVVTGVSKGIATVLAKISAEGCKDFEISCNVEIKPEDYTLALIDNFILITDLSTKVPEETELVQYLLSECRTLITSVSNEGYSMKKRTSSFEEQPFEILVGETNREESIGAGSDLAENEYSIKAVKTEEGMKLLINANTPISMNFAFETLVNNLIITDEGAFVPSDLDIKNTPAVTPESYKCMIETYTGLASDPCVLYYDGLYYMIAFGFHSTGYGVMTSEDLLHWSEPLAVNDFSEIPDYNGDPWAPELHFYNGAFYITATYRSSVTGFRGCAIFKADTPNGPFHMITDGHLTSPEWNAIDGTLYVDENGDPWFVYVREWVTAPNEVGTFEAARLSEDLTHLISEPVELFKATDPAWAAHRVTDGCWLYKMESTGSLIMLWSNNDTAGYCIGMARSESGSILGPWKQLTQRLYSGSYSGTDDGGHGSIFKTADGQLMLSFHSPNKDDWYGIRRHAFIMPIEEDPINDLLVPKSNN